MLLGRPAADSDRMAFLRVSAHGFAAIMETAMILGIGPLRGTESPRPGRRAKRYCVLASAIAFVFSLTWAQNAAAQSQPSLNNPAPQTGSSGSPVTVNDCSVLYFPNNIGQTFVAARGLKI